MEFKTNHSPVPFEIHHEDGDWLILDANGRIIAETWGADNEDMSEANRDLFVSAPAMLEYMVDRARMMSIYGFSAVENSELKRILAILKDAGVEVV